MIIYLFNKSLQSIKVISLKTFEKLIVRSIFEI